MARHRLRRLLLTVLTILITVYVLWCGLLYFMQDSMLFPVGMLPQPGAEPADRRIEVLHLPVEGGQVEAWFIPAPGAGPDNPRPVMIFFHGNAELIDFQQPMIEACQAMGVSLLLPEYRGYGRSPGKPSRKAIAADMIRFYDLLIARPDVAADRIVFHGRSLGGAVAGDLARSRPPQAMILQSTFTSTAAMAHAYGAPGILIRHRFDTKAVLRQATWPVLIFHGSHDRIIAPRHGRALRDAAGDHARYVEYPCGHNDFPGPGNHADYLGRIHAFLQQTTISPAAAAVPEGPTP